MYENKSGLTVGELRKALDKFLPSTVVYVGEIGRIDLASLTRIQKMISPEQCVLEFSRHVSIQK